MAPGPPGSPPSPPAKGRRRWILAAIVAVVAVVAASVVAVRWHSGNTGTDTAAGPTAPLGTPQDLLISFPLDRQPVPAWTITAADIGLPDGLKVGNLFASNGTKAYLLAHHCDNPCTDPIALVYGLDTATGTRLYPPIPLDGTGILDECFNNGPSVAVCVSEKDDERGRPRQAWVIDLDHGAVTYHGPTDLSVFDAAAPQPQPVGTYLGQTRLVATVEDKGIYGVGPHAELTWFVPGGGSLHAPDVLWLSDTPPLTIAVQSPHLSDPSDQTYRVFSVIDGTDLTPTAPEGTTLGKASVYNGGFAYEFKADKGFGGLLFYDTTGRPLARQQPHNANLFLLKSAEMPIALQLPGSEWQVYTAAGERAAQIPSGTEATRFKIIGTKLYVQQSGGDGEKQSWQQWDLSTNNPGPSCSLQLAAPDYAGSDGTVVITLSGSMSAATATDMTTCETLWEAPKQSFTWKIGTGLIQTDPTNDAIAGLRPPN